MPEYAERISWSNNKFIISNCLGVNFLFDVSSWIAFARNSFFFWISFSIFFFSSKFFSRAISITISLNSVLYFCFNIFRQALITLTASFTVLFVIGETIHSLPSNFIFSPKFALFLYSVRPQSWNNCIWFLSLAHKSLIIIFIAFLESEWYWVNPESLAISAAIFFSTPLFSNSDCLISTDFSFVNTSAISSHKSAFPSTNFRSPNLSKTFKISLYCLNSVNIGFSLLSIR